MWQTATQPYECGACRPSLEGQAGSERITLCHLSKWLPFPSTCSQQLVEHHTPPSLPASLTALPLFDSFTHCQPHLPGEQATPTSSCTHNRAHLRATALLMQAFLANYARGLRPPLCGAADAQANCIVRIPTLVREGRSLLAACCPIFAACCHSLGGVVCLVHAWAESMQFSRSHRPLGVKDQGSGVGHARTCLRVRTHTTHATKCAHARSSRPRRWRRGRVALS